MATQTPLRPRLRPHLRATLLTTTAAIGAVALACSLTACGPQSEPETTGTPPASTPSQPSGETDDDAAPEDDMEATPLSGKVLPEEMNGQAAIDALGDRIDVVAQRTGKTVEELKELLLRDPSAFVTPQGFVVYRDGFGSDPGPSETPSE